MVGTAEQHCVEEIVLPRCDLEKSWQKSSALSRASL